MSQVNLQKKVRKFLLKNGFEDPVIFNTLSDGILDTYNETDTYKEYLGEIIVFDGFSSIVTNIFNNGNMIIFNKNGSKVVKFCSIFNE